MRRLLLVILFGAGVALLTGLGLWQLDRAGQKRDRHAVYSERRAAPPLDLAMVAAGADPADYAWRRVTFAGHYQDQHVLLDNRSYRGQAGYEVLSPFRGNDGRVVLVDRGWIPLRASRASPPSLAAPADPTVLHGHLGPPPFVGLALDAAAREAEWLGPDLLRVQRLELEPLGELLQQPLWNTVLYLETDQLGAFVVDWPVPGDGSAKHQAYAVQWFAMATILAGIGLWQLRRPRPVPPQ